MCLRDLLCALHRRCSGAQINEPGKGYPHISRPELHCSAPHIPSPPLPRSRARCQVPGASGTWRSRYVESLLEEGGGGEKELGLSGAGRGVVLHTSSRGRRSTQKCLQLLLVSQHRYHLGEGGVSSLVQCPCRSAVQCSSAAVQRAVHCPMQCPVQCPVLSPGKCPVQQCSVQCSVQYKVQSSDQCIVHFTLYSTKSCPRGFTPWTTLENIALVQLWHIVSVQRAVQCAVKRAVQCAV